MKVIISFLVFLIVFFASHKNANAIVFIPALILIPIAKIVAVIIGGLSVPVLGLGGLWSKITKGSYKKGILAGLAVLLVIALAIILIFKIKNPEHPLL